MNEMVDSPIADTTMAAAMLLLSNRQPAKLQHPLPFRLFDLPTELIILILSHACISPTPIPITHTSHLALQPPITRATRLLRTEGLKLFYRHNTFLSSSSTLYGLSDFWNFLTCIGTSNATSIKSILVEWVSGPWEPRSLQDRTWEHFVGEMIFLTRARLPMHLHGSEVWVRTKGRRVVMGKGGLLEECYEVSLRRELGAVEGWVNADALAKEDVAWEMAGRSDFWVRDGEEPDE